ncbi:hypothetical protein MDV091.5 [Gallid alphaherpesvirus 2]|uniref:Uncharacterized protein n=1 Tax=Gallid alphaherpesvirus 2 TaxID=10390 RepID=Q19B28_9ALPH|nr:hypothetical protein MDV091.5 [Gallid alphaherpesvirus 2]
MAHGIPDQVPDTLIASNLFGKGIHSSAMRHISAAPTIHKLCGALPETSDSNIKYPDRTSCHSVEHPATSSNSRTINESLVPANPVPRTPVPSGGFVLTIGRCCRGRINMGLAKRNRSAALAIMGTPTSSCICSIHCFIRNIHKVDAASLDLPGNRSHSSRSVTIVIMDTPIFTSTNNLFYC